MAKHSLVLVSNFFFFITFLSGYYGYGIRGGDIGINNGLPVLCYGRNWMTLNSGNEVHSCLFYLYSCMIAQSLLQ